MTATVVELYAGSPPPADQYRRHRVWMRPGEPIAIGRRAVAEVQISILGDRRIPRLVCKGPPNVRRACVWRWGARDRSVVTLERGQWCYAQDYDVMVLPLASMLDEQGRATAFWIEFAALTPEAAAGWPA
jgi:hypothetical protein